MSKLLKLSKDVSLPLDAVTQTMAILAKRRAGKSYTARKLTEELLRCNQQVISVDPKGDQWGIRSSADGKAPGYPIVILGGEHGDAPLEVGAGEIVAKLVVEERVSVLLDLSQFRKHEISTFMAIFLENLYRLKAQEKYRTPVMLVVDEGDAIAPQKPQRGEERMLGAIDDIVRRGGQRGIGCALITQRSAVLNKNVLTQAQMLIVLRTIAPQDLAAMKAWIEVHGSLEEGKTMMDSLPSLPIGDAWFWSPGWPTAEGIFVRTHILPITTFDSGATPKPGERVIVPKNLADVDLDALKKQMAATIEKAKTDNPVALKKRIVELEKDLKNAKLGQVQQKNVVNVEVSPKVIKKAIAEAQKIMMIAFNKRDKEWTKWSEKVLWWRDDLKRIFGIPFPNIPAPTDYTEHNPSKIDLSGLMEPALNQGGGSPLGVKIIHVPKFEATISAQGGDGVLTGPEQRILDGIAWMYLVDVQHPSKAIVAFLAGYTINSSSFSNPCGSLRSKGLISYPNGATIALTEEGCKFAKRPEVPGTQSELHRTILNKLPGPERKILEPLLTREIYDAESLAQASGYSANSSSFSNPRGRLKSFGLIEYPEPGKIKAADILFIE